MDPSGSRDRWIDLCMHSHIVWRSLDWEGIFSVRVKVTFNETQMREGGVSIYTSLLGNFVSDFICWTLHSALGLDWTKYERVHDCFIYQTEPRGKKVKAWLARPNLSPSSRHEMQAKIGRTRSMRHVYTCTPRSPSFHAHTARPKTSGKASVMHVLPPS